MIPGIYEMALKQNPHNEELYSHLFMAYVRIGDYKKQQQVMQSLLTWLWLTVSNVICLFSVSSSPPDLPNRKRDYDYGICMMFAVCPIFNYPLYKLSFSSPYFTLLVIIELVFSKKGVMIYSLCKKK